MLHIRNNSRQEAMVVCSLPDRLIYFLVLVLRDIASVVHFRWAAKTAGEKGHMRWNTSKRA